MALAFLGGAIAGRLQLPVFVGYLITGLLLGSAGIKVTETLEHAGEIGVLLLLFGIGLHIRLPTLLSKAVLLAGGVHLLMSTAVFVGIAQFLGLPLQEALVWGVLLSFSSTVLAAKTLEGSGALSTYYGRTAIGILILQDVVAIGVMSVASDAQPSLWALALVPAALLFRWCLPLIIDRLHNAELQLLLAVLVALGVAEAFHAFGLSGELGAIMAGALVAHHEKSEQLGHRLWALKEILLVAFFVGIGLHVSPTADDWAVASVLTLMLPLKAWLFFALLVAVGLRARTAFLTGTVLTSYSEFTLIAGAMAHAGGMLSASGLSILALTTVLSFVIHLPVNRLSQRLYDYYRPWLHRFERDCPHPDQYACNMDEATHLVLGMGRTGTAAYRYLDRSGAQVLGMDTDASVLERHRAEGRRMTQGDSQDAELWSGVSLSEIEGVVITLPSFDGRLRVTGLLREQAPNALISTFALHEGEVTALQEAGADRVSFLLAEAGERLAELSMGSEVVALTADPGSA